MPNRISYSEALAISRSIAPLLASIPRQSAPPRKIIDVPLGTPAEPDPVGHLRTYCRATQAARRWLDSLPQPFGAMKAFAAEHGIRYGALSHAITNERRRRERMAQRQPASSVAA
jgi:hypothetical protein